MEEKGRNEAWRETLRKSMNPKERTAIERVHMNELSGDYRCHNSEEVNQGLTLQQAMQEAKRCFKFFINGNNSSKGISTKD